MLNASFRGLLMIIMRNTMADIRTLNLLRSLLFPAPGRALTSLITVAQPCLPSIGLS